MRKVLIVMGAVASLFFAGTALAATINGGAGDDVLKGTPKADTINGRRGDDLIKARNGDDTVLGRAGNDELFGQNGNDLVNGGTGNDELWGGVGPVPTFNNVPDVFKCGSGEDRIFDFEYGVDKIVGPGGVQEDPHDSATCEDVNILYGVESV